MKIALIAPSAIPANTANSIQTMKMAQAFAQLGHSVRVTAPGVDPGLPWTELASHYGLATQFTLQWLPRRRILRSYDYAFAAVFSARRWEADLVFTRLPQAAAYAASTGLRTVFEAHDLPAHGASTRLMKIFLEGAGAARLVAITQALAEALKQRFPIPAGEAFLLVAADGVDPERYKRLPSPKAARGALKLPEHFTAVYSGHLYAGRGVKLMLELAQRRPQVQFLLVGGRPEDVEHTRAAADRLSLENVSLTGFVPNAELPRYQAAGDLLLMPYQAQVAASSGGDIASYLSPMKMFEYLACGRPILASDLTVLGEVLNKENAIILPAGDADAWAEAIDRLQGSAAQRKQLGQAARRTAQKHTWTARAEHILHGLTASLPKI